MKDVHTEEDRGGSTAIKYLLSAQVTQIIISYVTMSPVLVRLIRLELLCRKMLEVVG